MTVRLPLFPTSEPSAALGRADLERALRSSRSEPGIEGEGCKGARGEQADERTLQVGDLAKECGKTVRAIHLYEELGLLTPQGRSKGRYRLYSASAIVRIRWIGKLQDMGFSLTDIQSLVRDWDDLGSASGTMSRMRELYAKKLEETQSHIRRLQALEREIVSSLDYLDGCDVCEPERLVAACHSCEHHAEGTEVPELVSGYSSAASSLLATPASAVSMTNLASSEPASSPSLSASVSARARASSIPPEPVSPVSPVSHVSHVSPDSPESTAASTPTAGRSRTRAEAKTKASVPNIEPR
jgi:DNA-binding transcriptional MerR regulator